MRIARNVAREAMANGADAVVLTGSHARGDANAHSDIDLIAIVRRDPGAAWQGYSRRAGFLVSADVRTAARVRAAFNDPARFTTYVPGWREAIIMADPEGIAARLQAAAHRWTWESVTEAADEWVAGRITGWAEEVHKLVGAMEAANNLHAATQRSLLAVQLAGTMAVHRRILCGTENVLWTLVAEAMGGPWAAAQSRALSISAESLDVSNRAALELYAIAAAEAWPLLSRQQRAVVAHACAIAGHPRV
jgi:hypothetical protein